MPRRPSSRTATRTACAPRTSIASWTRSRASSRSRAIRGLRAIKPGDHPKALVETLSEDLLETFRAARLLDAYDVYQHLMDYWAGIMQDDVYCLK